MLVLRGSFVSCALWSKTRASVVGGVSHQYFASRSDSLLSQEVLVWCWELVFSFKKVGEESPYFRVLALVGQQDMLFHPWCRFFCSCCIDILNAAALSHGLIDQSSVVIPKRSSKDRSSNTDLLSVKFLVGRLRSLIDGHPLFLQIPLAIVVTTRPTFDLKAFHDTLLFGLHGFVVFRKST